MSLVDSDVPKLKDQALWSDQANTTLYSYGGRGASNTSADEGVWTYTIADRKWQLQQTSIKPVRLVGGGTYLSRESRRHPRAQVIDGGQI